MKDVWAILMRCVIWSFFYFFFLLDVGWGLIRSHIESTEFHLWSVPKMRHAGRSLTDWNHNSGMGRRSGIGLANKWILT